MTAPSKTKPKLSAYKNTTSVNLYTEAGRCGPGDTVTLLPAQAKTYKGLELCKTK